MNPSQANLAPHAAVHPGVPAISTLRLVGGILLAMGTFVLLGLVPYFVEVYVGRFGVSPPIAPPLLLSVGGLLALLTGASFVLKPTSAWGPSCVILSVAGIAYLLYLVQSPVYSITFSHVAITITYSTLLWLLLLVPVLGLAAGLVATIEDWRHPGERARIMFH